MLQSTPSSVLDRPIINLDRAKADVRALKKAKTVSHRAAQEEVARDYGCKNWHDLEQLAKAQAEALAKQALSRTAPTTVSLSVREHKHVLDHLFYSYAHSSVASMEQDGRFDQYTVTVNDDLDNSAQNGGSLQIVFERENDPDGFKVLLDIYTLHGFPIVQFVNPHEGHAVMSAYLTPEGLFLHQMPFASQFKRGETGPLFERGAVRYQDDTFMYHFAGQLTQSPDLDDDAEPVSAADISNVNISWFVSEMEARAAWRNGHLEAAPLAAWRHAETVGEDGGAYRHDVVSIQPDKSKPNESFFARLLPCGKFLWVHNRGDGVDRPLCVEASIPSKDDELWAHVKKMPRDEATARQQLAACEKDGVLSVARPAGDGIQYWEKGHPVPEWKGRLRERYAMLEAQARREHAAFKGRIVAVYAINGVKDGEQVSMELAPMLVRVGGLVGFDSEPSEHVWHVQGIWSVEPLENRPALEGWSELTVRGTQFTMNGRTDKGDYV